MPAARSTTTLLKRSSTTETRVSKRKASTSAKSTASLHHEIASSPNPKAKRRKLTAGRKLGSSTVIDLTGDSDDMKESSKRTAKPSSRPFKGARSSPPEEKRLRRYRDHAPQSYLDRLDRVMSQRMFVIDRGEISSGENPSATFEMAGTTGNIYTVTISNVPTCTCPDNSRARNQCKHIIYVLVNVLKLREPLQYQLAFLSKELREIFSNAPKPPSASAAGAGEKDDLRKPIEGDCPICILEFQPNTEEIVWCQAGCGNNIHKQCFEQWAASKNGERPKCVYCRTPWQGDEASLTKISKSGMKNADGYVNVAEQLGLTGHRDYRSYHQPWVSRRYGMGY
ncbi:MAG: hypothetical protein M1825_003364 [Sarcosagium campestre]|nr:MAG: hypothetical protein M1825_003364 [Sarcosagium campestre]